MCILILDTGCARPPGMARAAVTVAGRRQAIETSDCHNRAADMIGYSWIVQGYRYERACLLHLFRPPLFAKRLGDDPVLAPPGADAQVWVLCLNSRALTILREMREPGVHAVALADFESGDSGLAKAKSDAAAP